MLELYWQFELLLQGMHIALALNAMQTGAWARTGADLSQENPRLSKLISDVWTQRETTHVRYRVWSLMQSAYE